MRSSDDDERVLPSAEAAGHVPSHANSGLIDFMPRVLAEHATVGEGRRLLDRLSLWGIPIVDGQGRYVGTLTVRSIVAAGLPVALEAAGTAHAMTPAGAAERERLRLLLGQPARHLVDLQVPVIPLSTSPIDILRALCRRSPVVPIVADAGLLLVGVASLPRAMAALYGEC